MDAVSSHRPGQVPGGPWRAVMPRHADGTPVAVDLFTPSAETGAPGPHPAGTGLEATAAGAALPGALGAAIQVVLLGPPGSGKSTQGRMLAQRLGIPHISTGELIREEVASGSELGRRLEPIIARGDMVADADIEALLRRRLTRPDTGAGFILDGFPRTRQQIPLLEKLRQDLDTDNLRAVGLEIPDQEVFERLGKRGRADDTPEVIRHRLQIYRQESGPVIDYFKAQGEYYQVDGLGTPEEVAARFEEVLRAPAPRQAV
ncbi:MAG TPA: adenylate kinase [Candidatus Nitrosotenuis sp.]|nr:adenylate kinase [Candidatus Nitrosotenuis sp.]